MHPSDLAHAYAVLGLAPPVTEDDLKSRYKALVKRWHPDRFQSDPVGQAEAAERLRDINLAYELAMMPYFEVAEEWQDPEARPDALPEVKTERPFSWSPERVDAVVESINRLNSWSVVPEMSVHRWLSLGAVFVYLVVVIVVLPSASRHGGPAVSKAASRGLGYFWLPLYLIWAGDREDFDEIQSLCFRVSGWVLMAAPAVIGGAIWIIG